MIKIILDTNIIFSALAFDKNIEKLFVLILDNSHKFAVYRSLDTSQELTEKLTSKNFLSYRDFSLKQIQEFLDKYFKIAILAHPSAKISLSRDAKDNKFLELAKEITADYLITGDKDLLILKKFEQTKILKPSQFLELAI